MRDEPESSAGGNDYLCSFAKVSFCVDSETRIGLSCGIIEDFAKVGTVPYYVESPGSTENSCLKMLKHFLTSIKRIFSPYKIVM